MDLTLTYTTIDNKPLKLDTRTYKTHVFKDNVGYVELYYSSVPSHLFKAEAALKRVVIPDGVITIDMAAFRNCVCLESIEIPNSVTNISNHAFSGCTGVTSVVIPNSVTNIGRWAFAYCTGLTSVEIPNSVTSIGSGAFQGCTGLTSIKIPNSVTTIGETALLDCVNLTNLVVPDSVTNIGICAFDGCKKLPYKSKITLSEGFILAYKGFNKDMSCRGFKYEIGKTYHEGKVKVCVCGFHACLNPLSVLSYYPNTWGNRFALVKLRGSVDFRVGEFDYGTKVAATDIKIIKELTFAELINEFNRLNK